MYTLYTPTGANDAALPPSQQHVPLDAYKVRTNKTKCSPPTHHPNTQPPNPSTTHPPHTNTQKQQQENLEGMVRFFRRLSNRHREVAVLLVTPPPLHERDWESFLQVGPCGCVYVCMYVHT